MGQELSWSWEAECDQVNSNNSTSLQTTNQNTQKFHFATVHTNFVILVAGALWQWQCTTWAPWRWARWSSPLSGWLWSAWSGSTTGSRRWTVGGPGKGIKTKLMLTFLHFLSFILFVSAKKTCDLTPSYEKVKNIINYLQVHCVSVPMLYVVPRKISQVPKLQCIHHVCCQGRETSSTFRKILLQPF